MQWETKRGNLTRNPVDGVERVTEPAKLPSFPTPKEAKKLLEHSDRYDAAMWTLLLSTGLRRGSFVSLTPESFRQDGIWVPKTKRRREWFISYADGCPLWRPELSDVGKYVWETQPPTPSIVTRHLKRCCGAAGLDYGCHALRHAFASWLVMMGEHMNDVSAWCHHTSTRTTEKYVHLRPRGLEQIEKNRERIRRLMERGLQTCLP